MSGTKKKQFYFSDKPIDLADITPLETEYPEKTFSPEPKTITMSFDCKMPKETAEAFKKQIEELNKESVKLTEHYMKSAIEMVENFMKTFGIFFETPDKDIEDRAKTMLISYIFNAFSKGWNDCFDYNVKHNK